MMMRRWAQLNERDRDVFRVVNVALSGRLAERATLDWALSLKRSDTAKRLALLDLIDSPDGKMLADPWRSAWRLIEESWEHNVTADPSIEVYHVERRLQSGDRSGALVEEIVRLVEPVLTVKPLSTLRLYGQKIPRRPKRVAELMSTSLNSGEVIDPNTLELSKIGDTRFLVSLAGALQRTVDHGVDIARRIGWDGKRRSWILGQLHRVYYVSSTERAGYEDEPDRFHHGLAPSVKLLFSVVARLADVDVAACQEFARRWRSTECLVHQRLWAAVARDQRIATAEEVGNFLLSLNAEAFWNLNGFPEIAELRAKRFAELNSSDQAAITALIRKRPPRTQWPKRADTQKVEDARFYWAVRELRRIELAGASLPTADKTWLDSTIGRFPELVQMSRVDGGFLVAARAVWVQPAPDNRFDSLTGEQRLSALESALSSARTWDENPSEGASDWMRQFTSLMQVLGDLESSENAGSTYPRVWECFAYSHASSRQQSNTAIRQLPSEVARVLALFEKLTVETVTRAIEPITQWLSIWHEEVVTTPGYQIIWHRLWPIAVETTNAQQPAAEPVDLNTVARASDDSEPMDLDTLNTPVGNLVGIFIDACPPYDPDNSPFKNGSVLLAMRNEMMNTQGRTKVIVRHRLIGNLPYFLAIDSEWTKEHLIKPLMLNTSETLALWRAVGRNRQFTDVLRIIGNEMAERAVKQGLGRETRQSLVFSLILECLWALQEGRDPAVPYPRVQQMIRAVDDEVRAHAANTVQRFVAEAPSNSRARVPALTPEDVFRGSVVRLLKDVWPQERSLATAGVSRAFADLPAAARDSFADAVNAIDRFLVPFDCWSMLEYGLYGEEDGRSKLSDIDNEDKAAALLQLLDRTIGESDGAVVPYDLSTALDQIQRVAPLQVNALAFRRLAAVARRA